VSVDQHHRHCADCGAALAGGQRYCLSCGSRVGSRSRELVALLQRVHRTSVAAPARTRDAPTRAVRAAGRAPAARPDAPPEASHDGPRAARHRGGGLALTLPSRRVSAVLVLAFLGFGVLLGDAAASHVDDALTASRRDVRVLLGPRTPATASRPSASSSTTSAGETPESEAEATPTPAGETPSAAGTASGAAKASKGSGASGTPSGSAGSGSSEPGSGSGSSGSAGSGTSGGAGSKLPAIQHVFVIMLDDQPYAPVFGPESAAHYLADTLEPKGALLVRYYAVAHAQLANTIALLSGQGPTPQTAQNCPTYAPIAPGTTGAQGQVIGSGCIYPSGTPTLFSQLGAKHLSWRAYIQGIDEGSGAPEACAHPALGAADPSAATPAPAGQSYATWLNPFVYFSALTGAPACAADDVGLSQLQPNLSNPSATPDFAYIAPDLCDDGNPTPCAPGAPAGLGPADAFLQRVVPKILASAAYKQNGLLVITVDQAPSSGPLKDSSSCCGQPQFPNLPAAGNGLAPEGGGQVGALLLSPFIKTHAVSQEPYNHFSLLRTIEDLFGLSHLGYAGAAKVSSFEASLFSGGG
jgi:phosphatidylinositol-3-phosphatase